jgi:polyhydroxybutyrate depolymerase
MIIAVVVLTAALAGCAWFPGGTAPGADPVKVPSDGCTAATPRTPGIQTMNITSGGVARSYLRRIPAGYDATNPTPVIFAIHGWQEGAQVHTAMSEWAPRADANGFVVIYPQGLGSPVGWNTTLGAADLAYIGHVLDRVEDDLCLDRRRVFAAGLSMGAFMSSSIACQFADRFAAVALIAGMRDPSGCAPSRAVPAVTFHGTADTWVPYGPTPAIVAAWAARNGCSPTPNEVAVAADVNLVRYLCPLGAEVGLYRIEGGGHAWPGSEFSRSIEAFVGFTTFSIHASDIAWSFFSSHPMPV